MTQAFKSHLYHQESIFKNLKSSSTSGYIIIDNYVKKFHRMAAYVL